MKHAFQFQVRAREYLTNEYYYLILKKQTFQYIKNI